MGRVIAHSLDIPFRSTSGISRFCKIVSGCDRMRLPQSNMHG